MARYHRTRQRYLRLLTTPDIQTDREDSGVQLDEPCSPVAKQQDHEEIVTMRHGVTITKISKTKSSDTSSMMRSPQHCSRMSSDSNGCSHDNVTSPNDITLLVNDTRALRLYKGKSDSRLCTRDKIDVRSSSNINYRSKGRTLNLEEDEGLGIRDSNSDLHRGDDSFAESVNNETDSTEASSDTDPDPCPRFSLTGESLTHESESVVCESKPKTAKSDKYSKKRKFRNLLPVLRRSQSVGCESELVPDNELFQETCPGVQNSKVGSSDTSDGFRRMIHKTCSADAAMMANEVLPLDPQELVRNKQKSSIARNMRKKLQKLKRRNTDSLLSAAIMTVRGSHRVTQADAIEWGSSFESLLTDKNGVDLFKDFLKSEFSEENIEFWIACEEFKSIRTNKLVAQAQRIYSDFIAIKAPKQVNLDSKTRLDTVTSLESPTRDMFRQAQKRIQYLMENDSYKRFLESQPYLHLVGKLPSADKR